MTNLIEIKNLFIEYKVEGAMQEQKTVHAVNDLSLEIKQGEILSIAGESGCGKSTLAKAVLQLIDVKSGEILLMENGEWETVNSKRNEKANALATSPLAGEAAFQCEQKPASIRKAGEGYKNTSGDEAIQKVDILKFNKKELKEFRKGAQIIFQNPYSSLNPKMKIYDILEEPLIINEKSLTKAQRRERVVETIKQVGLDESVLSLYPHEFSGGQRQRIAIARSLILKPDFIVADEPVSALDVSIQAQIINLLNELKEKFNLTFLFISHDLSVIKYLSDRVAIMYLGEIVELGTSEEIFNSPKHPYTQALLSANPGNKGEKIILKGELPSPTHLPPGCKFHTRCPHVMEVCKTVVPSKTDFSDTHCAYCHLY